MAEYLHNTPAHRARTLFATHYHEITRLAALYPGIQNYCVTVKEGMGEIVFLRKVAPGTGSRSYGIEVARLAGMPPTVLERAGTILKKLERKEIDLAATPRGKARRMRSLPRSKSDSSEWMEAALAEACAAAREEVPVGCVVVLDGRVIAADHNRTIQLGDPTAHAEILAIRGPPWRRATTA